MLTFKGYQIIEAETGEEGVRLAQEQHPSLVLMDIRLPGIDGVEALGRVRAAFQSKPIKVRDFVAAVERLLEGRRR